jgi:hypothetical protein
MVNVLPKGTGSLGGLDLPQLDSLSFSQGSLRFGRRLRQGSLSDVQ